MTRSSGQDPPSPFGDDTADHGWARLRHDRTVFFDPRVEEAAQFIADTGIAEELQDLVTHAVGRPRLCTVEGLLVGLTLACRHSGGTVHLNRATDILHWGTSERWRTRFGVPERPDNLHGFEAGYAVVRRLFHQILAAIDPSPLPKNQRLARAEADQILAAADQQQLQANERRLVRITNQVIEGSLSCVRNRLDDIWDGSLGLDATFTATFARGTATRGPVTSTDPDAGWYVRTGDHSDPDLPGTPARPGPPRREPRRGRRRDAKTGFGYDAALAIARNPHHQQAPQPRGCGDPDRLPALVMGMKLSKPGHDPGTNGIHVLADVRRRGHPAGFVAADALYNNCRPDDYQLPLRALGFQPTYGYRTDQLGIQAQAHGAQLIEGTWYCPEMPQPLKTATLDHHRRDDDPAHIDQTTWRTRADARTPYALAPKGRPTPDGDQRYMCPATAGRLQCPHKPASIGTDPRLPLVTPEPSPVGPPKICAQTSVTMAPEHGAKHWQPLTYGSPTWTKVHTRLRNSSEGFHGYAKNDAHESIERAQGRRIRGIAAQSLLLAFQLAHANQRKITTWLNTLPGPDGLPHRRAKRRTTKSVAYWTPTGYLDDEAAA
ncbi:hypothetical protein AB0L06_25595 [Spirillospora sp. NPDC052269]